MFPKGGMGKLMKQAQEMQSKMAKAQEEIGDIQVRSVWRWNDYCTRKW